MATQRPHTPSNQFNAVPTPTDPTHLSRGYGPSSHLQADANEFGATPANPHEPQRLGRFEENFDARTRGSSVLMDGDVPQRSASRASTLNQGATPSRSGTLKKKASVKRSGSLKRSGSRRSYAGSIRGVSVEDENRGAPRESSVFYTPVPTSGSPTEILANRFQAWRKLLKDLITYFREVAQSYEHRGKALLKVSNVINNTNAPSVFMTEEGLNDANRILRDYHKQALQESSKAKDLENDVISQLSGLRADLGQKIKEIKSLSGDFKNNVEKEKESTRKCVAVLEDALASIDSDPSAIAGKGDPYIVRLGVDRQVERQIDEENYLHRAYLNIENSGRELESIVIGEIQKAYNVLASIMKREADESYNTIDKLRNGPLGMPRDLEWNQFVVSDPHFVNPNISLRRLEDIEYPGKHHPATAEVRAGMLERKSKYLKSYTPGWYVLSPTHIHEFKSADKIYTQPPVMSLYLPDQKLGTHSQPGSSSHKFVLKGRQAGSMHRGHTWVFRAETYDTMLAWYEDIKNLTEVSGEERNAFVRRHARSVSAGSARSVSSDGGLEEDEADQVPYSANQSITNAPLREDPPQRPSPGGRFPSDLQVERHLHDPLSPSSASSEVGHDITTAAGGFQHQTDQYPHTTQNGPAQIPHTQQYPVQAMQNPYTLQNMNAYDQNTDTAYQQPPVAQQAQQPQYANPPSNYQPYQPTAPAPFPAQAMPVEQSYAPNPQTMGRPDSSYGDWMAPAAGGAAVGALGATAYEHHQQTQQEQPTTNAHDQANPIPMTALPLPSEPDSLATTPATSVADTPFLGNAEAAVPATASTATHGGPAKYTADNVFSRVVRQNTDISVSDLHVPGEYPPTPAAI
ncbi:hypothetical protein EJ04DRAFT_460178 [Polyplosphaeria fusca]|uniref:PH domain-containing protein n=1 Tax=Polyplosphaeria fusca TaxID=682080 RepID=A0A9P4V653_9PLEO|nr:hypothetical protein EJ04DRAFT_460178 [Polyplosphaeria fusca]